MKACNCGEEILSFKKNYIYNYTTPTTSYKFWSHLICGDFAHHVLWAVQRVGKGVLVSSSMQTLKQTLEEQSDINIIQGNLQFRQDTTEQLRVSSLAQGTNNLSLLESLQLPGSSKEP